MTKETQTQKNKKKKEVNKKEKNISTKKVEEKIEEPKKEVKAEIKKDNHKFNDFLKKVDDNRWFIFLFIIGFLIATLLFRFILWPDRIATLKDGTQPVATLKDETITADDLYGYMKDYYQINLFLNEVDDLILTEKYPEDDEMLDEIEDTAEYYYTMYEQYYGYTKEEFLSNNGFSSEDSFYDYLKLDYRRNKYYDEYAESLVTDDEIEEYYEEEVFGDIDSKHILVTVKEDDDEEGLTDTEAKELAETIIKELDNGATWDEVVEKYEDQITAEELGYQAYNASLESAYVEETRNLEVDEYSSDPVLTSYGYHIVYKVAEKDKPKLKTVKDDIIDTLASEKKSEDSNLYVKSLIKMREDEELEFSDTVLKEQYEDYIKEYK